MLHNKQRLRDDKGSLQDEAKKLKREIKALRDSLTEISNGFNKESDIAQLALDKEYT